MKIVYAFTQDSRSQDNGAGYIPGNDCMKNMVFSFTLGDARFTVQPNPPGSTQAVEVPAKILRQGALVGSGITIPTPAVGDRGPHEDFLFMKDSVEYTYTTRALVGGGVIEKQMPSGAQIGDEGRMILYKGCTSVADAGANGTWTARLVRPFIISAADLTDRQTGWPSSGSVPTIDVTSKSVVNNGGDGYAHI